MHCTLTHNTCALASTFHAWSGAALLPMASTGVHCCVHAQLSATPAAARVVAPLHYIL